MRRRRRHVRRGATAKDRTESAAPPGVFAASPSALFRPDSCALPRLCVGRHPPVGAGRERERDLRAVRHAVALVLHRGVSRFFRRDSLSRFLAEPQQMRAKKYFQASRKPPWTFREQGRQLPVRARDVEKDRPLAEAALDDEGVRVPRRRVPRPRGGAVAHRATPPAHLRLPAPRARGSRPCAAAPSHGLG